MKRLIVACLSISILLSLMSACGSGEDSTVSSAPFEAAVKDYCKSKNMGMRVASFEKINVKDNDATAVCKMEIADGSYGMKVTWLFTFKKENDKWKAISQETKK